MLLHWSEDTQAALNPLRVVVVNITYHYLNQSMLIGKPFAITAFLRFVMTFLTSFAKTLHAFLNLSGLVAPRNVPPPEINAFRLLKNLSCLKLMTVNV